MTGNLIGTWCQGGYATEARPPPPVLDDSWNVPMLFLTLIQ